MLPRDKTINILVDFSLSARYLLVAPDPVVGSLLGKATYWLRVGGQAVLSS